MATASSYTITQRNNITEKEGISFLLKTNPKYFAPDGDSRKLILNHLGIDAKKFYRTFDMIYLPNHEAPNTEALVLNKIDLNSIILIELKTTKKYLPNNPKGFFFGATKNEFDLAETLGDRYKFSFVSLHPDSLSAAELTLDELNNWDQHKRIQYQISLK